jgi:hypothetical protein
LSVRTRVITWLEYKTKINNINKNVTNVYSIQEQDEQCLKLYTNEGEISGMEQQCLKLYTNEGAISGMEQQCLKLYTNEGAISGMEQQCPFVYSFRHCSSCSCIEYTFVTFLFYL